MNIGLRATRLLTFFFSGSDAVEVAHGLLEQLLNHLEQQLDQFHQTLGQLHLIVHPGEDPESIHDDCDPEQLHEIIVDEVLETLLQPTPGHHSAVVDELHQYLEQVQQNLGWKRPEDLKDLHDSNMEIEAFRAFLEHLIQMAERHQHKKQLHD